MISFLNACQSAKEGFKLKKGNRSDEFLVEKKNPLVLPPDYNKLPEPDGIKISDNENNEENFETKLITKKKLKKNDTEITKSKSTEEFILKKIKKNESN